MDAQWRMDSVKYAQRCDRLSAQRRSRDLLQPTVKSNDFYMQDLKDNKVLSSRFLAIEKTDFTFSGRRYTIDNPGNGLESLPSLEGDTSVASGRRISCSPGAFAPLRGSRCDRTCPNARPLATAFWSPGRSSSYGTKIARAIDLWIAMQRDERAGERSAASASQLTFRRHLPSASRWIRDLKCASSPSSFSCRSSIYPAASIPWRTWKGDRAESRK